MHNACHLRNELAFLIFLHAKIVIYFGIAKSFMKIVTNNFNNRILNFFSLWKYITYSALATIW